MICVNQYYVRTFQAVVGLAHMEGMEELFLEGAENLPTHIKTRQLEYYH